MTDLVQRLRASATQARAIDRAALLHEAADEIERRTLSEDEREALVWFTGGSGPVCPRYLAILREMQRRLA